MKPRPVLFPHFSKPARVESGPGPVYPIAVQNPLPTEDEDVRLTVDVIDDYAGFISLRSEWDALLTLDPESGVFLSWSSFESAFALNPRRWRVFVVREDGRAGKVRCIFPTKYRVHWSTSLSVFQTEIEAAGRLNWSEYVGFVCDPVHEEAALIALARHLSALPWVLLSLRYESSTRRADIFAAAFDPEQFSLRWKPYLINGGATDNLRCPRLHLPGDIETWMATSLSGNTRQKLRRHWRAYMDAGRYHITFTQHETLERDLDILFSYWLARWSPSKGVANATLIAREYRDMLLDAHRRGSLHLSLLWEGARTLAILAAVVDWPMGKLHFILSGRDEDDPSPAIGLLIHASNISWAIDHGLRVYDFGHGNEPYKYSFGSIEEHVKYFELRRITTDAATLDPFSHGEVLRRLPSLLRSGKLDEAIAACEAASVLISNQD